MSFRLNPDARRFAIVAEHRYEDAEILLNHGRTNAAIYLAGYAVECMMKAVAISNVAGKQARAEAARELKEKFGHNLDALRKRLSDYGYHMPPNVLDAFRRVNTWDTSQRYDPKRVPMEDAVVLLGSVQILMVWMDKIGA